MTFVHRQIREWASVHHLARSQTLCQPDAALRIGAARAQLNVDVNAHLIFRVGVKRNIDKAILVRYVLFAALVANRFDAVVGSNDAKRDPHNLAWQWRTVSPNLQRCRSFGQIVFNNLERVLFAVAWRFAVTLSAAARHFFDHTLFYLALLQSIMFFTYTCCAAQIY